MEQEKVYSALNEKLADGSEKSKKIRPKLNSVLWTLSWAGILVILLTSLSSSMFEGFDKILHYSAYLMLGLLFTLSQRGYFIPLSLMGIIVLSAIIEVVQHFIGRSPEWNDLVVNVYGVGSGFILGSLIKWGIAYFRQKMSNLLSEKRSKKYRPGQKIFSQDSKAKYLYVVTKGEVILQRTEDGEKKVLGGVEEGGVFGEMGLITGSTRYASAKAGRNCSVFAMSHDDLFQTEEGKKAHPFILIIKALAMHLQRSNKREDVLKQMIVEQHADFNKKLMVFKKREVLFKRKVEKLKSRLSRED